MVAIYNLTPQARIKLGFLRSAPLFLVVYDSGRVAVIYRTSEDITIEVASAGPL